MECSKITFTIKEVIAIITFTITIGYGISEFKNLFEFVNEIDCRLKSLENLQYPKPLSNNDKKLLIDKELALFFRDDEKIIKE